MRTITAAIIIAALLLTACQQQTTNGSDGSDVTDFASCAAAGNPVMESYPRQCRAPDGRAFTERLDESAQDCGECPQLAPPGPGFCPNGTIVSGAIDACGCRGAPRCEPAQQAADGAQLANPASQYCLENGGRLEIVLADDGSQSGLCTLADGTGCDEWAYFRGECPQ